MTKDEIDVAALVANSTELDIYDFAHESDEDDYVSMMLYRAPDGRHYRHIIASGMSSFWAGAMDIVEWLDDDAVDGWADDA